MPHAKISTTLFCGSWLIPSGTIMESNIVRSRECLGLSPAALLCNRIQSVVENVRVKIFSTLRLLHANVPDILVLHGSSWCKRGPKGQTDEIYRPSLWASLGSTQTTPWGSWFILGMRQLKYIHWSWKTFTY